MLVCLGEYVGGTLVELGKWVDLGTWGSDKLGGVNSHPRGINVSVVPNTIFLYSGIYHLGLLPLTMGKGGHFALDLDIPYDTV